MRKIVAFVVALVAGLSLTLQASPSQATEAGSGTVERILGVPVQKCVNEDGSGGPLPCRWDAWSMGVNREGRSYWIDRSERVHFVGPRKMYRVTMRARGWYRFWNVEKPMICFLKDGTTSKAHCRFF